MLFRHTEHYRHRVLLKELRGNKWLNHTKQSISIWLLLTWHQKGLVSTHFTMKNYYGGYLTAFFAKDTCCYSFRVLLSFMLAHRHVLPGHRNTAEPSFMLLGTPELSLLWQVKKAYNMKKKKINKRRFRISSPKLHRWQRHSHTLKHDSNSWPLSFH